MTQQGKVHITVKSSNPRVTETLTSFYHILPHNLHTTGAEWSLVENCFAQEKSRRDDGLHVEQVRMVSLLKDPAEW